MNQLTNESLFRLWKTGAVNVNRHLTVRSEDEDFDDVSNAVYLQHKIACNDACT